MKNKVRYFKMINTDHALAEKTVYFRPTAEEAIIIESTDAVGGVPTISITSVFTAVGAIGHEGIYSSVTYQPTGDSGTGVPIGLAGQVVLGVGATHSGLYMWGVQGHVLFSTGSVIASSQIAALRGVLEESGEVTYTSGGIAGLYIDNLITSDIDGISGNADLMRIANHGGAIKSAINIYSKKITYLFSIDGINACFVSASGNEKHGGTVKHLKCKIDGTTCYLIASSAPTT